MAIAKVMEANRTLNRAIALRTGAVEETRDPFIGPDTTRVIARLRAAASALDRASLPGQGAIAGFATEAKKLRTAADVLETRCLDELKKRGSRSQNFDADTADERARKEAACESALASFEGVVAALSEAARRADDLEANGAQTEAQRTRQKIANFKTAASWPESVAAAEALAREAGDALSHLTDALSDQVAEDGGLTTMTLKETRETIGELKTLHKTFFMTAGGKPVRWLDRKSQEWEQVRAVSARSIPPETLQEMELRLLAAEQLASSESAEAAKLAIREVASLKAFMTDASETSSWRHSKFKTMLDYIDGLEKRLDRFDKKYPLFGTAERTDLRRQLADLRKACPVTPPETTRAALWEIEKAIDGRTRDPANPENSAIDPGLASHTTRLVDLQGRHYKAVSELKLIETDLKHAGKALKGTKLPAVQAKAGQTPLVFDGKSLPPLAEVKRLMGVAERRTEAALDEVEAEIEDLKAEALALLKAAKAGKSAWADPTVRSAKGASFDLSSFLDDCHAMQAEREANLAQKDAFKSGLKTATHQAETLITRAKTRGLDPTMLEAYLEQAKALGEEISASEGYIEGLERLALLRNQINREGEASEQAVASDRAELAKAAAEVVSRAAALETALAGYYAGVLEPAILRKLQVGSLSATTYDAAKLKGYFAALQKAVPTDMLKTLKSETDRVTDSRLDTASRRQARETALRAVRQLMTALDTPEMRHFARSPFGSADERKGYVGLRAGLPKLELRLLRAI